MTEFVDVVEVNPVVFVNKIVEHIANGFYVQNTLEGYPVMGHYFQIRLFETEEPAIRNKLDSEIHTVVVEGYDIAQWLLDVQDIALQGFKIATAGASVDNYKSVTLSRPAPVKFQLDAAPEKPAKAKRAAKPKTTEGETE